jgi:hypothetical protein
LSRPADFLTSSCGFDVLIFLEKVTDFKSKGELKMYLSNRAPKQQVRLAEQAQRNRQEIIKALSHGTVSRRDLVKWGLFTAGGALALKNGLNPFVGNAYGEIPTGVPRSPLFGAVAFSTSMPRCDLMKRKAHYAGAN